MNLSKEEALVVAEYLNGWEGGNNWATEEILELFRDFEDALNDHLLCMYNDSKVKYSAAEIIKVKSQRAPKLLVENG